MRRRAREDPDGLFIHGPPTTASSDQDALFSFLAHQCMQAKQLVTACGVRSVPALHIYARGALVEALSANPKKWAAIEARLEKVSAGFGGSTAR